MPLPASAPVPDRPLEERLAQLEARLARIEERLGDRAAEVAPTAADATAASAPETVTASTTEPVPSGPYAPVTPPTAEGIEMEVGQNWFAVAGIIAVAVGLGFLLCLPYRTLPAALPGAAGFALAGIFFGLAHLWRQSFAPGAASLRAAGLVLLCLAGLRLSFFGASPALAIDGLAAPTLLLLVTAANLAIAWRLNSPALLGLALGTGHIVALAVNTGAFVLPLLLALAVTAAVASVRRQARGLLLAAMPLAYVTYQLWAMGNPFRGPGGVHYVTAPPGAPLWLLGIVLTFAAASRYRPGGEPEDGLSGIAAGFNCAFGYLPFLLHTAGGYSASFAVTNSLAALAFIGTAVAFYQRGESRVSTFFYAMTGYGALSMAIFKVSAVPAVFVWLSLQSLLVVTTAILFRSRFIIVANFFIFVGIILGYVALAERETGISVGFGVVALVSARILNWQQSRLELKTELMRNAYLVTAFIVFPYALAHLVPGKLVAVSWVGLAIGYYVMNLIVQSQKYRWMGHGTLLITTVYVVVVGTSRFEPVYRVLSFLVLGTVLLIVSLGFKRGRKTIHPA